MHIVQILLPMADNKGHPFPRSLFADLRRELTERFGGATFHSRAPAEGSWQGEWGTARNDVVLVEVMCETLDEGWWRGLRGRLERDFRQEEVVVRAIEAQRL